MEVLNLKENNSVLKEIEVAIQSNKDSLNLFYLCRDSRGLTRDKEHRKSRKNTCTRN